MPFLGGKLMILFKNVHVYAPEDLGIQDVLVAGTKIEKIAPSIDIQGIEMEIIDGKGKMLIPGLIDNHVHICGGGGEGGFANRTPSIDVNDMVEAGVTTVFGLLGTDGTTRTMANLLAQVYGIESVGLNAYALTGSYEVPVKTITSSIQEDIILFDKIIGTGEIAISDHRSCCPSEQELIRLVSQSRLGGILSGKSGVVIFHLGDGKEGIQPIYSLFDQTDIPNHQVLLTHMARNPRLFEEGLNYAKDGGFIDFTTSRAHEKEFSAADALIYAYQHDIPLSQITISSDGQGSLPVFDEQGNFQSLTYATCRTLKECLQTAIKEIPLEKVLPCATSQVADLFHIPNKGRIQEGKDADLVLMDDYFEVEYLVSKGQWMKKAYQLCIPTAFR